MISYRSLLCATLLVLTTSSIVHAAQASTQELTVEQKDTITARLNNHMAVVGGTSVAALVAGLALKNDVLRGIRIGGSLGTACYALEEANWGFMWLASGLARMGLTSKTPRKLSKRFSFSNRPKRSHNYRHSC